MSAPVGRNGNAESRIQASICQYIRSVLPDGWCFAIPNGGLRSKSEAALLKWTGVVAGIPDLEIRGPGGLSGFIEVKTPGNYLSPEQKVFRDWCAANGHHWGLARSIDDARTILAAWGIQTREAA